MARNLQKEPEVGRQAGRGSEVEMKVENTPERRGDAGRVYHVHQGTRRERHLLRARETYIGGLVVEFMYRVL